MRIFEIVPLVGVGPVRFGMPREECRKSLQADFHTFSQPADAIYPTDAFDLFGMHVHYSGEVPIVDFILLYFTKSIPNAIFTLDGNDIFQTDAAKLVEILATKSEWYDDFENLVFPALELALYREHPFDPEYDVFDRWDAVSVGRTGYLKNEELRAKLILIEPLPGIPL